MDGQTVACHDLRMLRKRMVAVLTLAMVSCAEDGAVAGDAGVALACFADAALPNPVVTPVVAPLTEQQELAAGQALCEEREGMGSPTCAIETILTRDEVLCAALDAGADPVLGPWVLRLAYDDSRVVLTWRIEGAIASIILVLDAHSGALLTTVHTEPLRH